MHKPEALPADVLHQLGRLQAATRNMPALESEIDFLEQRLANGDMSAAHLGIRITAEALLRHAARVEQLPREGGPATLHALEQALRSKVKGRIDEAFWDHLKPVQGFGNRHAHYQLDDVYHAAELRRADPWTDVGLCLGHLASMVIEFTNHWPPPPGFATVAVAEASGPGPTAPTAAALPRAAAVDLGDLSSKQALEDGEARLALEAVTGMTRGGISRRLNSVHGRTKIRNVFPEHFGASATAPVAPDSSDEAALDYETIGNLTISDARELEVAHAIARLTGLAESTVKRKLADLNGNGVVRRQFSWYDAATIRDLSARTALDYGMGQLLARALKKRKSAVEATLREAAGQTKLRTLYPELDA